MDYKTLTDDQLSEYIWQAIAEQDRRARLQSLPRQIEILTATYIVDGGDPDDLTAKVS